MSGVRHTSLQSPIRRYHPEEEDITGSSHLCPRTYKYIPGMSLAPCTIGGSINHTSQSRTSSITHQARLSGKTNIRIFRERLQGRPQHYKGTTTSRLLYTSLADEFISVFCWLEMWGLICPPYFGIVECLHLSHYDEASRGEAVSSSGTPDPCTAHARF